MTDAISRSAESEIYPIDGEALFNRVQNLKRYDIRRNMFDEIAFMHVFKDQDVLSAILSSKRLDVAPVVTAMWMLDSSFYSARIYHCTACNTKQMQTSKFCPECGAKMDGEP